MLTASLGWTGDLPPRTPLLNCSLAIPAITSLVFMFVEVPLPVWKMSTTNWSSCWPSATACAAWTIRSPSSAGSSLRSMLTCAAAFLIRPRARMNGAGTERADLEVPPGAGRLGPVIGLDRDLHLAHRVFFHAGLGQGRSLRSRVPRAPGSGPAPRSPRGGVAKRDTHHSRSPGRPDVQPNRPRCPSQNPGRGAAQSDPPARGLAERHPHGPSGMSQLGYAQGPWNLKIIFHIVFDRSHSSASP